MAATGQRRATEGSPATRAAAENLLTRLVGIRSLSGEEGEASEYLAGAMRSLGFDRSMVDDAGNAVGEMGSPDAGATVLLLGHIDTVKGHVPVRVEGCGGERLLYGRGSVDAKGSLAAFTSSVARLGSDWTRRRDVRLVVVGAVEEEAATSRGARFIRDRFNGTAEPVPDFCIIGEPSGSARVTLGYKGRLLVDMEASQPMAHSAGPHPGVATIAVDLWKWVGDYAAAFNCGKAKTFDQLLPSLRKIHSWTDEAMQDRVHVRVGVRLPPAFGSDVFLAELFKWAREAAAEYDPSLPPVHTFVAGEDNAPVEAAFAGDERTVRLRYHGHEPAWRGGRNNALVRSFLAAIRDQTGDRPRFVSKSGTSDMNVVGPAWNCPIVAYGPGDSSLDHTPNEHISLDEYWRAVNVLESALRRLA